MKIPVLIILSIAAVYADTKTFTCDEGGKIVKIGGCVKLKAISALQFHCSNDQVSDVYGQVCDASEMFELETVPEIKSISIGKRRKTSLLFFRVGKHLVNYLSYLTDYAGDNRQSKIERAENACPLRGMGMEFDKEWTVKLSPIFSCSETTPIVSNLIGEASDDKYDFECADKGDYVTSFGGSAGDNLVSVRAFCKSGKNSDEFGGNNKNSPPFKLPDYPDGVKSVDVRQGKGIHGIGINGVFSSKTSKGQAKAFSDPSGKNCPVSGFTVFKKKAGFLWRQRIIGGIQFKFQCPPVAPQSAVREVPEMQVAAQKSVNTAASNPQTVPKQATLGPSQIQTPQNLAMNPGVGLPVPATALVPGISPPQGPLGIPASSGAPGPQRAQAGPQQPMSPPEMIPNQQSYLVSAINQENIGYAQDIQRNNLLPSQSNGFSNQGLPEYSGFSQ